MFFFSHMFFILRSEYSFPQQFSMSSEASHSSDQMDDDAAVTEEISDEGFRTDTSYEWLADDGDDLENGSA